MALTAIIAAKQVQIDAVSGDQAKLRGDLCEAEADHFATREDLSECMEKLAEREQLCQDLRNQMISQGMLRDEQRIRIERLEGYIDRVREIDSLTHLGMRPAEDTGGV